MTAAKTQLPEPEIVPFTDAKAWRKWLSKNYELQQGIWMQLYKKASDVPTITYAEAVRVALCYGWIDGQKKSFDEQSFLQKFTPRRKRSMWSKNNIEIVEKLIADGQMQAPGLKEIEAAKLDGRWAQAYDKPSKMEVPADFLQALAKKPKAQAFFKTLTKANTYAIAWRLQTAKKAETRQKRFDLLMGMMERGEKLH